jgi:predicted MFS family arabinose efflux permease
MICYVWPSERRLTTRQSSRPPFRVFRGWWIVAALCTVMFVGAGSTFYAMGVFVRPLEDQFGWSRGQVSIALSLPPLVGAFFSPVAAAALNRFGARVLIGTGGLMTGICLGLLGLTPSLPYFCFMLLFMAAWQTSNTIVSVGPIISNWFHRKRGLALGLATTGIGLGGLIFAPLVAVLIDAFGWRSTFYLEGGIVIAAIVPLALFVILQRPEDVGLVPDGVTAEDIPPEGKAAGDGRWSLKQAVRTPTFFVVTMAFSLASTSLSAVLIHVVPFLEDRGFSSVHAGLILGGVSGTGIIGKIGSGYLVDRVSPRLVTAAVFLMQGCGLAVLLQSGSGFAGILIFVLVFGYAMGSVVTLQPIMAVYCFGVASIAMVLGLMVAVTSIFNALGPVTAGFVYDRTGGYGAIFVALALLDCLAAGLVYFLGSQPVRLAAVEPILPEGAE